MGKILIVGVGNTVMGDDGLGVHALNVLRSGNLPANVDTLEAGTALLDALPELREYDKIILLDAIESDGNSVVVVRDPFSSPGALSRGFSLHEIGIEEALRLTLVAEDRLPEVVIIGMKPACIGFSTELSESVAARIPELVNVVMNEIHGEKPHEMAAMVSG